MPQSLPDFELGTHLHCPFARSTLAMLRPVQIHAHADFITNEFDQFDVCIIAKQNKQTFRGPICNTCVCIYIYMYVYMYICIYIYINIYIYIYMA